MKWERIRKTLAYLILSLLIISYGISAASPYISPADFKWISVFNLGYVPLLFMMILACILCLFFWRRASIVLAFVLLLSYKSVFSTLAVNAIQPRFQMAKQPGSFRLMSWNVNEFGTSSVSQDTPGGQIQTMINFIKTYDPDIITLQDFGTNETKAEYEATFPYLNKLRIITQRTAYPYILFASIDRYDGTVYKDKTGILLLSRFPLVDTASFITRFPEKSPIVTLLYEGKPISIVSSHLSSMSLWPTEKDKAGLEYFKGDSTRLRTKTILSKLLEFGQAHATEAMAIRNRIDTIKTPLIFTGDLNSVPSSYVYRHIRGNLNDAFIKGDYGIGGTYNRVFPKLRIDVMFYTHQLELVQFIRPATDLSDHYPLVADFRWQK